MKVVDAESSRILCNLEVLEILRRAERRDAAAGGAVGGGGATAGHGGSEASEAGDAEMGSLAAAQASEKRVRECLEASVAGRQTHAGVKAFLNDPELQPLSLAQRVTLANIQPGSEVGAHPILGGAPAVEPEVVLDKLNEHLGGAEGGAEGAE